MKFNIEKNNTYSYEQKALKIAETVYKKGKLEVLTPNGLNLIFRKGVFIPDAESFNFISEAENLIANLESVDHIADIGTGSGVITISLAKRFKNKTLYAYDSSIEAINLAKQNSKTNNVSNISFFLNKGSGYLDSSEPNKIDLIISNPPYTGEDEFNSIEFSKLYPDYKYQPENAIRSYDEHGVAPYISILEIAQQQKVKYVIFRVNSNKIDFLISKLQSHCPLVIEKIKTTNGKEEFLFIKI